MKSFGKTLLSLSAIIALLSVQGHAFQQEGVVGGNTEIAIYASHMMPEEEDQDARTTVGATWGYFFTDNIQAKVGFNLSDSGGEQDYSVTPGLDFYVEASPTLTPYIGGGYYYSDRSDNEGDPMTGYNAHLGINIFVNEKTAIAPEYYYVSYESGDFETTFTVIQMAIKLFF
ncbi:MAG: outer membrane beta-barrel protein [Campylobacterota bacterium]|nr:outer membrane beta-barrel protein [Campylobacterota bacterium]